MNPILVDLSQSAIVRAIEWNLFELIKVRSLWPRAEVHDDPQLLWSITDIPYPHFNLAMRTQIPPEQVDAAIQAAIQRCMHRKVPMGWWCGPTSQPATLRENLAAHGFMHVAEMLCMAVDLQQLPEQLQTLPEFSIREINDPVNLKTWCQIVYASTGMPDFVTDAFLDLYTSLQLGAGALIHYYLGWLKGEPVAGSMLWLGAGVAGIYNVATVAEARKQGFGSAITLAPLLEARAMGYRLGVLQSTEMGVGVYRRLGFQEYGKSNIYIWPGREK